MKPHSAAYSHRDDTQEVRSFVHGSLGFLLASRRVVLLQVVKTLQSCDPL